MRKAKYLSAATAATAAAAIAAMTVIVSCSAAGGSIDSGGNDRPLYSISTVSVAGETQNGKITASSSKANAGQSVSIEASPPAASVWEGTQEALTELTAGGGGRRP